MTDWTQTPEALQLLAELDAAERAADCWSGRGWSECAEAFAEKAREIEDDLSDIRRKSITSRLGLPEQNGSWTEEQFERWFEADGETEEVSEACKRARRLRMGDALFEQAMAA